MPPMLTARPILILGPTAGGKSELAVAVAERLGGEVLGADSMQVYRHMDAGTAKPEPDLRARAPHHLIDIVEPTERFTVHDWLTRAEPLVDGLRARGATPVIVGGTNLYLKALLEGLFEGPGQDAAFRAAMEAEPLPALRERLLAIDPAAAGRIDANDRRRMTRALEVHRLTGRPISALQTQWEPGPAYRFDPVLIGLHWPAEAINPRINARVKQMFFPDDGSESLPDEAARLEAAGLLGSQAREALGYKQVLQALRGEVSMGDAMERTKIETRRFAKQQRSWLKRYRGVRWLDAPGRAGRDLADEALAGITS